MSTRCTTYIHYTVYNFSVLCVLYRVNTFTHSHVSYDTKNNNTCEYCLYCVFVKLV